MRPTRSLAFLACLALAALLAGCSGPVAITPEVAQAAPARLKADLGPDGDARRAASTVSASVGGAAGAPPDAPSMRMAIEMAQELYPAGAFQATVTVREFAVEGGGGDPPRLSGLVLRIFCAADRWVLSTEGMAALDGEDVSRETPNRRGACSLATPEEASDFMRLAAVLGPQLGPVMPGIMTGFAAPEYEFVALDGGVATYRVTGGAGVPTGVPANATGTFDGEGRLAGLRTVMDVPGMGMHMEASSAYGYGARDAAPDVHGAEAV